MRMTEYQNKKEIASFIEVSHCQQAAVLFLKNNHFLVQSK